MNHEDTLKSIHDKIGHVFGPLLKLWTVMEEEKQIAMEYIDSKNGDTIPLMEVSTLFEQSILLLAQAFNATSYFRRKSILDTLFNVKSKVKEILKEQSDLLNDFSNQCLFGSCSENEF